MSTRQSGTVNWLNAKGYGYITPESGPDVLVRATANDDIFLSLKEGQKVTFVAVQGEKGMEAHEVQTET